MRRQRNKSAYPVAPVSQSHDSSQAFASLLPEGVAFQTSNARHLSILLHPLEEDYIVRQPMHPKRQAQFRVGRACAREALAQLGIHAHPLIPAATRAPLWPAEVVGTITHCDGFCAVAVADAGTYLGIGIDAEVRGRVGEQVATMICTPAELRHLNQYPGVERSTLLSVIFCAKESVFKAVFPRTGEFMEFDDVELRIDLARSRFTAHSANARKFREVLDTLQGAFIVGPAHVMASAWQHVEPRLAAAERGSPARGAGFAAARSARAHRYAQALRLQ